jgi:hypothetical protein
MQNAQNRPNKAVRSVRCSNSSSQQRKYANDLLHENLLPVSSSASLYREDTSAFNVSSRLYLYNILNVFRQTSDHLVGQITTTLYLDVVEYTSSTSIYWYKYKTSKTLIFIFFNLGY